MSYSLTDDPEAEIRRLAGEVRRLWGEMDANRSRGRAALPLESTLRSMDLRIAQRALTDALLAHPDVVLLDRVTCLLPSIDGTGPAFLAIPEQYASEGRRDIARGQFRRHLEAHRRRFAPAGRARVPA